MLLRNPLLYNKEGGGILLFMSWQNEMERERERQMKEGPNSYTYMEPTRDEALEAWITNGLPPGYKGGSYRKLGCYLIAHLEAWHSCAKGNA